MLTVAFLIAGVLSFLVAAAVAVWRLVIQNRDFGEMPAWEPLLGIINGLLAMMFFSLGIFRALQSPNGADEPKPTPIVEGTVTAVPPPPSGPTVIIIPYPTPAASSETPAGPTATRVAPAVEIDLPRDNSAVATDGRVEGTSSGVAPGQVPNSTSPWLYVLVRRTDTEGVTWWVQSYPVVDPDGTWDTFLGEGIEDMETGTPFDICAIVTNDLLPTGPRSETPQAYSRDCVSVEAA
jgi:hypothetical protein